MFDHHSEQIYLVYGYAVSVKYHGLDKNQKSGVFDAYVINRMTYIDFSRSRPYFLMVKFSKK